MISGQRTLIRYVVAQDMHEFLAMNRASATLHHPWVKPPLDEAQFAAYLERSRRNDTACLLVCAAADSRIVGAVNISQIFYGNFQSAYMGYFGAASTARQGFMTEGIALALDYAFGRLGLHRIEANIQPTNTASTALVRRLGFTLEGFSRRYLQIDGDWRDHERWAMLAENWADLRTATT